MPCMCWYIPNDEKQKQFKDLCVQLVQLIKDLEREGDPYCCTLKEAHQLIDHLYRPGACKEINNGMD